MAHLLLYNSAFPFLFGVTEEVASVSIKTTRIIGTTTITIIIWVIIITIVGTTRKTSFMINFLIIDQTG